MEDLKNSKRTETLNFIYLPQEGSFPWDGTCNSVSRFLPGAKKVKQVVDELRPTMYTPTKRKINKKPTGDNKGGEITVEELYTEAKNIVLRNKMLTAAGAAAVFIIIIMCYCCCR